MKLALVLVCIASARSVARAGSSPCQAKELDELAFWVGDWDATWPSPKHGDPPQHGHNTIERIVDGCAFQEHFTGAAGFVGTSISSWSKLGGWHQTWIDSQAAFMDFRGRKDGATFVFARDGKSPDGAPVKQRMVFENITKDAFDWSWESSPDGKTWTVQWPIHYTRTARPRPAK